MNSFDLIYFPKHLVKKNKDYYQFEFGIDESGKRYTSCFTVFTDWDDIDKRIEIREPDFVKEMNCVNVWIKSKMPFSVVNNDEDYYEWLLCGGNALVIKEIAKKYLKNAFENTKTVQTGRLGFHSVSDLPKTIFNKAPTKKKRMEIIKRDNYRCRICNRRPENHTDIELHVHHIRPFGNGGLTHGDNLITLCSTCHDGLDPHYEWDLYNLLEENMCSHDKKYIDGLKRYRDNLCQVFNEMILKQT